MNTHKKLLIIVITILVSAVIGFVAAKINSNACENNSNKAVGQSAGASIQDTVMTDDPDWGKTVIYNGVEYHLNKRITTVMFLGVDEGSRMSFESNIQTGSRADTIILFVLDDETETSKMLLVSRDTMTEVDVYKTNGDFAYSGVMQIDMQYSFGDSARRSCFLMKKTVSELLYGIEIDGCISLSMDGISEIVDAMGGLTLKIEDDYTDIDERYAEGAIVKLSGAEAERFVRYRDKSKTGSNDMRMARQSWLINEILRQLKASGKGTNYVNDILDVASDYIESNLSAEMLKKLSNYKMEGETLKVPGATSAGILHDEYYVDEAALKEMIVSVFYIPIS